MLLPAQPTAICSKDLDLQRFVLRSVSDRLRDLSAVIAFPPLNVSVSELKDDMKRLARFLSATCRKLLVAIRALPKTQPAKDDKSAAPSGRSVPAATIAALSRTVDVAGQLGSGFVTEMMEATLLTGQSNVTLAALQAAHPSCGVLPLVVCIRNYRLQAEEYLGMERWKEAQAALLLLSTLFTHAASDREDEVQRLRAELRDWTTATLRDEGCQHGGPVRALLAVLWQVNDDPELSASLARDLLHLRGHVSDSSAARGGSQHGCVNEKTVTAVAVSLCHSLSEAMTDCDFLLRQIKSLVKGADSAEEEEEDRDSGGAEEQRQQQQQGMAKGRDDYTDECCRRLQLVCDALQLMATTAFEKPGEVEALVRTLTRLMKTLAALIKLVIAAGRKPRPALEQLCDQAVRQTAPAVSQLIHFLTVTAGHRDETMVDTAAAAAVAQRRSSASRPHRLLAVRRAAAAAGPREAREAPAARPDVRAVELRLRRGRAVQRRLLLARFHAGDGVRACARLRAGPQALAAGQQEEDAS